MLKYRVRLTVAGSLQPGRYSKFKEIKDLLSFAWDTTYQIGYSWCGFTLILMGTYRCPEFETLKCSDLNMF